MDYYSKMFAAEKRQRKDAEHGRNKNGVVFLLPVGNAFER